MKLKGADGRRRYDLYLSEDADARLIEHLDKFVKSRRTNQEIRRLLYLALDAGSALIRRPGPAHAEQVSQARPPAAPGPDVDPVNTVYTVPAEDTKSKLKKSFGMPR